MSWFLDATRRLDQNMPSVQAFSPCNVRHICRAVGEIFFIKKIKKIIIFNAGYGPFCAASYRLVFILRILYFFIKFHEIFLWHNMDLRLVLLAGT